MADKLPEVAGKFRLRERCGTHTEPGIGGVWFTQPSQVVEGRSDLAGRFPEKFERVDNDRKVTSIFIPNAEDGGQQTLAHVSVQEVLHPTKEPEVKNGPSKEDLDTFETYKAMTIAELKEAAVADEIELGDARNKKDILDVFAKSLGISTSSE